MELNLGQAVVAIVADDSKFNAAISKLTSTSSAQLKGLGAEVQGAFSGIPATAQKSFGQLNTEVNKLGESKQTLGRQTRMLSGEFSNLSTVILPLIGVAGLGGLLAVTRSLATEAYRLQTAQDILNLTLERTGQSSEGAQNAIRNVSQALGVAEGQVTDYVTQLVRIGFTSEQVEQALIAGGASALAFGKTAAQGIDSVASALVTQNSQVLNTIGIAENIGAAMAKAAAGAAEYGEQAANQAAATAGLEIILKATASEVDSLDKLTGGLAGAQNRAATATFEAKRAFGEMLIPLETLKSEAIAGVLNQFTEMPSVMQSSIVSIGGVTTAVAVLATGASALRFALIPLFAPPAGLIIAGVAAAGALAGAIYGLATSHESAATKVDRLTTAASGLTAPLDELQKATSKEQLLGTIETLAATMDGEARTAFENYANAAVKSANTTGEAVIGIMQGVAVARRGMLEDALDAAEKLAQATEQNLSRAQSYQAGARGANGDQKTQAEQRIEQDRAEIALLQAEIIRAEEGLAGAVGRGATDVAGRYQATIDAAITDIAYLESEIVKAAQSLPEFQVNLAGDENNAAIRQVRELKEQLTELKNVIATGTAEDIAALFSRGAEAAENFTTPPPPDTTAIAGAYEALIVKRKELTEAFESAATAEQAASIGVELQEVQAQIAALDRLRASQTGAATATTDAVKANTEASVSWIQRLTRETETGLKPVATTVDLLTEALERQRAEQVRLANAGLIDGAQYDIAAEKVRLLEAALSQYNTVTLEPKVVSIVTDAVDIPKVQVEVEYLVPNVPIPMPEVGADFTDHYKAQQAALEDLIASQGRLMEMRQRDAEAAADTRWGDGLAFTIQMLERTQGAFTTYEEAMYGLSSAGLWNAETQALMAERFKTNITNAQDAEKAYGSLAEQLMSLGTDADPVALTRIREELEALKSSGFGNEGQIESLETFLAALESLDPAPLETLRETLTGLFDEDALNPEGLIAFNDVLMSFDGSQESLRATVDKFTQMGEQAGLTKEQVQELVHLLTEAALLELGFDVSAVEDSTLNLLSSLGELISNTEMFGDVGDVAASVVISGYEAVQEAQEATRIAQEAAALYQKSSTEENRVMMVNSAVASEDAWRNALATIGAGIAQVGGAVKGLGSDTAQMAGDLISHAGNIAMAFATDPSGVTGMLAIATAGVDMLIKAFNRAAEEAKRVAAEMEAVVGLMGEIMGFSRSTESKMLDTELINLETKRMKGQITERDYIDQRRDIQNRQALADRTAQGQEISDWAYQELQKIDSGAYGYDAVENERLRGVVRDTQTTRRAAVEGEYEANVGRNNAKAYQDFMRIDHPDAMSGGTSEQKAPAGSVQGMRDQIAELGKKRDTSTNQGDVRRFQGEIDKLEAEIQRLLGKGPEAIARGTVDWYQEQIKELRDKQGKAKTPGEHASLQKEIDKHQGEIDKIQGNVRAEAIKNSVGWYEEQIKGLREAQKATTNRRDYQKLEDQINNYQQSILAITDEAGAEAVKGSLDWYEARIKGLKEKQGSARNPGEYAAIQNEIDGYQTEIDKIKGLGDLEGSINHYTDLLRKKQEEFNATTDATVRAALAAEITQLESTIEQLQAAGEASQGILDQIKERFKVGADDLAGVFKGAMDAGDYESFTDGFRDSLRSKIRDAIVEGQNDAADYEGLSNMAASALADGTVTQDELNAIETEANRIAESKRGVYDLMDSLTLFGDSLNDAAGGMGKMNAELTNVPSGLKLAAHRFRSAGAEAQEQVARTLAPRPAPVVTPSPLPQVPDFTTMPVPSGRDYGNMDPNAPVFGHYGAPSGAAGYGQGLDVSVPQTPAMRDALNTSMPMLSGDGMKTSLDISDRLERSLARLSENQGMRFDQVNLYGVTDINKLHRELDNLRKTQGMQQGGSSVSRSS